MIAADITLPQVADDLRNTIIRGWDGSYPLEAAILNVAEETGEFIGAYRRYAGLACRTGGFHDVATELADVIIAGYVAASFLEINLNHAIAAKLAVIYTRPFRNPRNGTNPAHDPVQQHNLPSITNSPGGAQE